MYPLPEIDELLRAALDVRLLNKEIAAFADAPAEVAILYSQTSTLQLPPEMLTWETTPYLAELRNTYNASQYLDAKVTFVTERKIRQGWLKRYKLLLVAAVRNIPADVVEQIQAYASQGGRVLITPESLLGDEYNRPAPYLGRMGIDVRETKMPRLAGGENLVQGYDQSFSHHVVFADDAPVTLEPAAGSRLSASGALKTRGIRQEIQTDAGAEKLFAYPDGRPAVVRIARGSGAIYYAAASLEDQPYAALLDALFEDAGVTRPVRVTSLESGAPRNIESRYVDAAGRKLLYVVNFGEKAASLRARGPFTRLRELRSKTDGSGAAISIAAGETRIYELF